MSALSTLNSSNLRIECWTRWITLLDHPTSCNMLQCNIFSWRFAYFSYFIIIFFHFSRCLKFNNMCFTRHCKNNDKIEWHMWKQNWSYEKPVTKIISPDWKDVIWYVKSDNNEIERNKLFTSEPKLTFTKQRTFKR